MKNLYKFVVRGEQYVYMNIERSRRSYSKGPMIRPVVKFREKQDIYAYAIRAYHACVRSCFEKRNVRRKISSRNDFASCMYISSMFVQTSLVGYEFA